MAKIFDVQSDVHESPNRNNHDLMHKRHMSGKFGYIYPFLAQPVVPTDDWEIDTAIGVNLNPLWYPTQSNMRFIVHYFYVPYRIMYKDWKNFVNGLDPNAVIPYHDISTSWFKTGTLADFLGIPTNYVSKDDFDLPLSTYLTRSHPYFEKYILSDYVYSQLDVWANLPLEQRPFASSFFEPYSPTSDNWSNTNSNAKMMGFPIISPLKPIVSNTDYSITFPGMSYLKVDADFSSVTQGVAADILLFGSDVEQKIGYLHDLSQLRFLGRLKNVTLDLSSSGGFFSFRTDLFNSFVGQFPYVYGYVMALHPGSSVENLNRVNVGDVIETIPAGVTCSLSTYPSLNPWCSENQTEDKDFIDSFAARGYEMIYNSYYRNQHGNQPFVVSGEPVYNQYIPSDDGDADSFEYKLHKRNWELDAYTSCLPSPQQGNAPLVGVTIDGQLQITHDDGSVSTADLRELSDGEGIEVTRSNIQNAEDARTIISVASSGMTIADFRQGNALTRFLEQSLRSGFRYADFLFGHFGKSPSHQELDMPIFLGGYTQIVDVNKVTNVTASQDAQLGQFAGSSSSFGSMKHKINHYFDDYGMVFGLMMLVPDAAYSQILPKHFLYRNRLDFYFPEFSQLGLQPITYSEICPVQSHAEYVSGQTDHKLTDTFGYQRPNHELVWLPDTVHGLFRTSLQGSVIQRRFGSRPELSDEFLTINPDECNDIFSVIDEDEDTWTGQIVCAIKAKRPVPHVVVPSLGR